MGLDLIVQRLLLIPLNTWVVSGTKAGIEVLLGVSLVVTVPGRLVDQLITGILVEQEYQTQFY